ARAAFVAAASTPLALPVMIDARAGSELTYSVTRSGSAKCRLPTMATRNLSCGGSALADHRDVLVEHRTQLGRLAIVVVGVGPAVSCVEDLARHTRHMVWNVQAEHRIDVSVDPTKLALQHCADDGACMSDRHP